MENYQIFISYRRDGGEFLGKMLYDRLTQEGYRVFYDVETIRSGQFNNQLYDVIKNCTDVIVLCTEGSMERCVSPEDWVRKEMNCALKNKKNIIPIYARNFQWPSTLPEELQPLITYEGLNANVEVSQVYWDALINRLCKHFLHSKPVKLKNQTSDLYPETVRLIYTKSVEIMLNIIDQQMANYRPSDKIFCFNELRKFFLLLKNNKSESYVMENKTVKAVISWFYSIDSENQQEVIYFFQSVEQLEYFEYKTKNKSFNDGGITREIYDIFPYMQEKYALVFIDGNSLLPKPTFYQIINDQLIKVPENSAINAELFISYSLNYTLNSPLVPAIGDYEEFLKSTFFNSVQCNIVDEACYSLRRIYNYYYPVEEILCSKKGLFKTSYSVLDLSLKNVEEWYSSDGLTYCENRSANLTGLSDMILVDMVNIAPRDSQTARIYAALFLPCKKQKLITLINSPVIKILPLTVIHNNLDAVQLDIKDIDTPPKEAFSGAVYAILERFSLKINSMIALGLIQS